MAEHHEESDGMEGDTPKKGKKKLIVIVLVLLLLAGGGAGLFFSGIIDGLLGKGRKETEQTTDATAKKGTEKGKEGKEGAAAETSAVVYYNLPDVMANLNPGSPTPSFIKTSITLEAPSKEVADKLQAIQPKIQDIVITYVRELRPSDLKGSAGVYRLRDELMLRINKALAPDKITNVLFKELLIQ